MRGDCVDIPLVRGDCGGCVYIPLSVEVIIMELFSFELYPSIVRLILCWLSALPLSVEVVFV